MIIDCFILFPFKGVPKSKRGEIWRFLAKQHKLQSPPGDQPWNEKSYEEIKEGLSTHQHSIFIDLGKYSRFFLPYTQFKSGSVDAVVIVVVVVFVDDDDDDATTCRWLRRKYA